MIKDTKSCDSIIIIITTDTLEYIALKKGEKKSNWIYKFKLTTNCPYCLIVSINIIQNFEFFK
jgi:hypothetical protein